MSNFLNTISGRQLFLAIALGVGFLCLIVGYFFGYSAIWSIWNEPVMTPHFADLRVITGASKSISLGHDPLFFNPGDPWNRELNQPRIWQYIVKYSGINETHTTIIGIATIAAFFVSVFVSFKHYNRITGVFLALVVFSPAAMLGIERANSDLLIFILVALAINTSRRSSIGSAAILFLAAALKFFPIFAATLFLKYSHKRFTAISIIVGTLFVIYLAINFGDLPQIMNSTLKGVTVFSYGSRAHSLEISLLSSWVPYCSLMGVTFLYFIATLGRENWTLYSIPTTFIDSFRVGAGIYIGTFSLGNNWSYRLVFLVFVVPQLIQWCSSSRMSPVSRICMISLIFSFWSIQFDAIPFSGGLDEFANWIMVSTLLFLLLTTLPPWLIQSLTRIRDRLSALA